MLRRWQHLGGLLPQAAAASSVAAFDWLGPLAAASTGGPRQLSSRARYQQEQQPHAADAWQLLKGRGDGGRGDGGKQLQRGHEATDAPDDRPRTLPAFQSLVSELARRRKCVAGRRAAGGCAAQGYPARLPPAACRLPPAGASSIWRARAAEPAHTRA